MLGDGVQPIHNVTSGDITIQPIQYACNVGPNITQSTHCPQIDTVMSAARVRML